MTTQTIDRTAERMAYILGRQQNATGLTYEPDALKPAQIAKPRPDLGPNQLQWCRENIPSFETCERQAIESEAHRLKLLDAVKS